MLGSCATATAAACTATAAAATTAATTATAPATGLFAIIMIIMLVVVVRNEDNHHDGHRRRGPPGAPKRLKRPKSGIIGSGRSARLRAHPQNRVESGKIGFLRVESGIIGSGSSTRPPKSGSKGTWSPRALLIHKRPFYMKESWGNLAGVSASISSPPPSPLTTHPAPTQPRESKA